jgi:glutaredoxin
VLRFIQAQGIQGVELKDIAIAANYHTLVTVGGMDQYPCLFIDGKPLYESDDIIAWLGANAR